ncbi:RNA-dependent RNA polymerase [Soybean leaf-associated negative-stranded RNA virus 2]|uniref:RNA-directed RNA polymerase n=1 Tax=Soybean leaf-associated negative-stranded RNA virus 2 TaxID=1719049 RepID=A0A0S1WF48_9MONO|nr:RNA-dependent RNA polymerase [Soybean leaf-associated negative-stranded RNA virus 2]ALM62227.1 RNA-dependent RNA polymerase [Soybean leaf-associated negative-stranded RNA virus 2]
MARLDFLVDDGDSPSNARSYAPPEKHLQSPITSSLLDRLLELYREIIADNAKLTSGTNKIPSIPANVTHTLNSICRKNVEYSYSNLERVARPFLEDLVNTAKPPKILTPDLYPRWFKRTITSSQSLLESLKEAETLYKSEVKAYNTWAALPEMDQMLQKESDLTVSPQEDTYRRYECYRHWDLVVERYRSKKKQKKFGRDHFLLAGVKYYFYDGYIMEQHGNPTKIHDSDGKVIRRIAPDRYIYTFEQLQMIQDALLARFNAFLAIDAGMHNGNTDTRDYLARLLIWQEKVLVAHGNLGYELVKGPESVAKSYLTSLSQGDVMPISSFVRTVAKLQEKEKKLSKTDKHDLTDELVSIITSCTDYGTTAELFGCTKLSGHPFVYANISAASVRDEGCPLGNVNYPAVMEYHRHFKHMVLERYLEKHKVWPPFSERNKPRAGTRLSDLWTREVHKINDNSYELTDWDNVEFGKFMEFDYSPDYLDMIDDKAICPGAQYASDFWFKSQQNSPRRLLESLIKRKEIDTVAIVDRMRKGRFFLDERIIELTQKEREFKTSARCFCKLTFEVRLCFILTEANLKRFMGGESGDNGYLPQQTMTMSNSKMRKRLYDMTSSAIRHNSCVVEVDFSRWNLRWRGYTVNPISRTLEKIFGLPGVFSQAHPFFQSATVVLTDKHTLPRGVKSGVHASLWPESDLVWRNHRGGFEGIQQTLWTICTLSMMYFSLRDENCSFKMAGQGDNQVFYLTFNKGVNNISPLLLKLLTSIERECERLNHEVKPEECIDSRTVLTYGKEIYISGVHVLYSLKFSSRAFARADYSTPSLTKEVASIVANSISVAGTLNNTFRAVWWKHIQVLLLLRRRLSSPLYRREHNGIKRLLLNENSRNLLLIPGSLGGLPMMPWTRYFSKGETDDVSFDCAATYYLSRHVPIIRNYISLLLEGEFLPAKVDITNLINDPHSIPIDRPNDATHLIAAAVGKALPSAVKNVDIHQLVSPALRTSGEKYKEILTSMRPLHPVVASDLFELTPAGLYNKTVKRFSMTRTIERIVPGLDLTDEISQASARILSVLLDRMVKSARHRGRQHPRPFQTASLLRAQWNCDLKNSSVGIYTPFDFELGYFTTRKPTISAFVSPDSKLMQTCGKLPPNFGTTTRQKISDHGYRIANCNSTMRDLKSAIMIYSELQGDDSIKPMIDSIVQARSPWCTEQLLPIFPSQYGGSQVHRHAANKHHFGVLGSCSVSTHITLSSDRSGILSGGELDYPVVFQTLYLTLNNIFQNLSIARVDIPSSLAYIIPHTLESIDDSPSLFPTTIVPPKWPSLDKNRLAYVDDMFATEVPTIPDRNMIPHILRPSSATSLIFSYLDAVVSPSMDSFRAWDGILSARDIFDFKEISRVNPYHVETAFKWILIVDTYHEILGSIIAGKEANMTSVLNRRSLIYAGAWVRIRLHPMFSNTDYNKIRRIALQPGKDGYKRPVEYMATFLRRVARETLDNRDTSSLPNLILFNNWKDTTALAAKRRMITSHLLATYPEVDIESLSNSIMLSMPPKEMRSRDPATFMFIATRPRSRRIAHRDYELPEVPCCYLNLSPEESMRQLRSNNPELEPMRTTMPRPRVTNYGLVSYTDIGLGGTLKPIPTNEYLRLEDRLRTLRRRKVGKFSPLFSDWNAVLLHIRNVLPSCISEVHILGVGRGALARFFASVNMEMVGYDLQHMLPVVAHRSSSYKPPELLASNNSHLFRWSDHTYTTNGDVLEGRLDFTGGPNQMCVIDLDVNLDKLLAVLARLPVASRLIARFAGSSDEIRYLISILRPEKIYCLLLVDHLPRDVIMYVGSSPSVGSGNYESISYNKLHELTYTYVSNELSDQFWDMQHSIARTERILVDDSIESIADFLRQLRSLASRQVADKHAYLWDILNTDITTTPLIGKKLRVYAICRNILDLVPAV